MDRAPRPFIGDDRDDVCITCPARVLGAGEFNVAVSPSGVRYDRRLDYRVDAEMNPTCVHPSKVGLRPGNYLGGVALQISMEAGAPEPEPLNTASMPYDIDQVRPWISDVLNSVTPEDNLHKVLAEIEDALRQRFNDQEVLEALRFVLSNL